LIQTPRIAFHTKMLIGVVAGIVVGVVAHLAAGQQQWLKTVIQYVSYPIGQIFLRLLFMLIVPLIFSALVLGVTGLGDLRQLGRIGAKTLAYTVAVSAIAVLLGISLMTLFRPGDRISDAARVQLTQTLGTDTERSLGASPKGGLDLFIQIVPDNPIKAAANGDMLAVMFFALLFGIALSIVKTDAARRLEETIRGLYDVTMKLIDMVISLAPVAVGMLLFTLTAGLGYEILLQLAGYVGVVLLAMAIHQFGVYPLSVLVLGKMSPRRFFSGISDAMLTAFSTASSNATLPTSLRVAEEKLKLPPQISRFVLTIGSTTNQNGTALFEGMTVLFLAQFYGVTLSLGQQLLVVMICILGGIGTAGVPAGSIPVVVMILSMVGVPPEGIGLILGVDRFLDMCRTTLNVTGDLAAAVAIAGTERTQASS